MRERTPALVTAALAVAGLVVSLTALWPRLDDSPPVEPGLSAGAVAVDRERPAAERPTRDRARPPTPRVGTSDATLGRRADPGPPRTTGVTVPAAGLDAPVRPVGVARDGQMQLPEDPEVLGWYRFGPAAGEGRGSVVVAGHLDSVRYGLGPLVGLREVAVGDPLSLTRGDGSRLAYTVVDVRRYDRQALPDELFSRTGPERLRIITCGGAYVPGEGYEQNLVVTAVPRARASD